MYPHGVAQCGLRPTMEEHRKRSGKTVVRVQPPRGPTINNVETIRCNRVIFSIQKAKKA